MIIMIFIDLAGLRPFISCIFFLSESNLNEFNINNVKLLQYKVTFLS